MRYVSFCASLRPKSNFILSPSYKFQKLFRAFCWHRSTAFEYIWMYEHFCKCRAFFVAVAYFNKVLKDIFVLWRESAEEKCLYFALCMLEATTPFISKVESWAQRALDEAQIAHEKCFRLFSRVFICGVQWTSHRSTTFSYSYWHLNKDDIFVCSAVAAAAAASEPVRSVLFIEYAVLSTAHTHHIHTKYLFDWRDSEWERKEIPLWIPCLCVLSLFTRMAFRKRCTKHTHQQQIEK